MAIFKCPRITVVLNGKQELHKVLENLKNVFQGYEKVLLITKSEMSETFEELKKVLSVSDEWISSNVTYDRFNEIDYSKIAESDAEKKIFCIRMPNSLYRSISTAYNDALKFIRKTSIAKFAHFFTDDCKIISDSYNPASYEWFMEKFNEPFIMDSKLNQGNYAFKKYSPRFVFMSKTYLKQPISFVQHESKEHFIMDVERLAHYTFDEKVKRLYIPELIFRLHKDGIVKHTSFYPDPILEQWVKRDETLPFSTNLDEMVKEYASDEKYLRETLKVSLEVENAVDPIIKEVSETIMTKLMNETETDSPKIVIPKLIDDVKEEGTDDEK